MILIEIEKVALHDVKSLKIISEKTFYETFAETNTTKNIQKYLYESFNLQKLSIELENPNSEFYFAKINKKIVGYLKINFKEAQTELFDSQSLEIERIYVLKKFIGEKVGQALFNKALEIAKQKKNTFIWLGVWEKNLRAIHFYQKNKFIPFDSHFFMLGNDKQTDIMMKLIINEPI